MLQMQQLPWTNGAPNPYQMPDNSCMAQHQNMPNFMGLAHAHASNALSSYPMHAQTPTSVPSVMNGQDIDTLEHTEIRSSSIAALRLKAREHSVSMGLFSAYAK